MSPELKILTINAAILLVAYLGIYPSQRPRRVAEMIPTDLVLSVLALGVAGLLFWGSGVRFSLIFVEVNWFWFSLLTITAMEIPLLLWFMRRYDVPIE